MIISVDLEASGLLNEWEGPADKIHVISYKPLHQPVQSITGTQEEIKHKFLELIDSDEDIVLVIHNQIGYDLRLLKKLYGIPFSVQPDTLNGKKIRIIDTYVLSTSWYPDLPNGHSLDAWGNRLGTKKPVVTDWSEQPLEVYVHRCEQDTIIQEKTYLYLCDKLGLDPENPVLPFHLRLSHKTYALMVQQEETGVKFDIAAAEALVQRIDREMEEIRTEVEPKLPQRPLNKTEEKLYTPPKIQFLKNGEPSAACLKWFDKVELCPYKLPKDTKIQHGRSAWLPGQEAYVGTKAGINCLLPFHVPIVDSLPMELKNQAQMKDWLLGLGWTPSYWNVKKDAKGKPVRDERGKMIRTSPKFSENGNICPGLERLGNKVELIKQVTTWLSLRNRRSVLINEEKGTGWLSHPRLKYDGRLPAASSGLTNTHREKHKVVANIPRVTSPLGKEFRSLFMASEGKVYVGYDASGLEARIKGHYTYEFDNGAYAQKLLDPDWDEHTENASLWLGKPESEVTKDERQDKKPGTFALQYNCQPPTLARTLGVSVQQATEWWDLYWQNNWSLRKAIEATEQEWIKNGKKYVVTIDGSKIVTRHQHSVFNAKCQSAGQKVMNLSLWYMDHWLQQRGIPAQRVVVYHDEAIFECDPEHAELVAKLGVRSITKAGEYFKLNVPLTGEAKVGTTWESVH